MTDATAVEARRREIVVEHLLFHVIGHVEERHPGLLDRLEASLDHLGDPAQDDTKDDAAVVAIARRMIGSARANAQ